MYLKIVLIWTNFNKGLYHWFIATEKKTNYFKTLEIRALKEAGSSRNATYMRKKYVSDNRHNGFILSISHYVKKVWYQADHMQYTSLFEICLWILEDLLEYGYACAKQVASQISEPSTTSQSSNVIFRLIYNLILHIVWSSSSAPGMLETVSTCCASIPFGCTIVVYFYLLHNYWLWLQWILKLNIFGNLNLHPPMQMETHD